MPHTQRHLVTGGVDMMTFAYPWVLLVGFLLLGFWLFARWRQGARVVFKFPLADVFAKDSSLIVFPRAHHILDVLRALTLAVFIFLIARPQLVDQTSRVVVEGVDIMLALDVSRSMEIVDDRHDQRTRAEISKQEAVKFIDRRANDAMGVVVFAADALSLCPLTFDKKLLKETVQQLMIGRVVDEVGTALGAGLATAINRLRASQAKSKVIVLLTDGCPEGDFFDIDQAIELAKLFNIKVYTIGIGGNNEAYLKHPGGGVMPIQNMIGFDMKLLKKIADRTGGLAFEARKPHELEKIYNKIDELEKTKKETFNFSRREEAYLPFAIAAFLLFVLEFILRFLWWRFPA